MLNLRRVLAVFILPALVLAGCSTTSHRHQAGTGLPVTPVPPEPRLADPPVTPPDMVRPSTQEPKPAAPSALSAIALNGTWIPLSRWAKANDLVLTSRVDPASQVFYTITAPLGKLVIRLGGSSATWEGLDVRLGYQLQIIDGQPCLHILDMSKTIEPLLAVAPPLYPISRPVIVIDAGHGGTDSGARSVLGNYYEKDYALDWALRLRALLQPAGWQVYLTRTNDVEMAISNRVALAERYKADLFVSLHFNSAAPNETESGLETYCLTPAGLPSNLTRGYGDDLAQVFPNNSFDKENLHLALRVHRALLKTTTTDRGLRRARFLGVLRGQQRPAILVEGGYLSNRAEARLIATPEYRQKLAQAVFSGLVGAGTTNLAESKVPSAVRSNAPATFRPPPESAPTGLSPSELINTQEP